MGRMAGGTHDFPRPVARVFPTPWLSLCTAASYVEPKILPLRSVALVVIFDKLFTRERFGISRLFGEDKRQTASCQSVSHSSLPIEFCFFFRSREEKPADEAAASPEVMISLWLATDNIALVVVAG